MNQDDADRILAGLMKVMEEKQFSLRDVVIFFVDSCNKFMLVNEITIEEGMNVYDGATKTLKYTYPNPDSSSFGDFINNPPSPRTISSLLFRNSLHSNNVI